MAVQVNPPVFNENGERQTGGFCPRIFNAGFDTKFLCKHCHCILREPVQSPCGHRFCCSCRDVILADSRQVNCPACLDEQVEDHEIGQLSMSSMFPDNAVKREMSVMATTCVFPGCNWRGRFKEYEAHERSCEFKQIACGQCGQAVTDGHLEEHRASECPQRHVTCNHCQTDTVFARLQTHLETCEKMPITCDNCSKPNIVREMMKAHLEQNCPKRSIKCPMGCSDQFQQDKFPEHLQKLMESHLAWTVEKLMVLERKVEDTVGGVGMSPSGLNQVMGDIKNIEKKVQLFEKQVQKVIQERKSATSAEPSGSEGHRPDGVVRLAMSLLRICKLIT